MALPIVMPRESRALFPTAVQEHGPARAHLFGVNTGLGLWEIRAQETRELMAAYAASLGVRRIIGINPGECNTQVMKAIGPSFPQRTQHHGVDVVSGLLADGLYGLEDRWAFWMRPADCHTIVLWWGNEIVVLHAGRKSLFALCNEREYGRVSVLVNGVSKISGPSKEIRAAIICGVGPESYELPDTHEKYGAQNAATREEVVRRWGPQCVVTRTDGIPSLSLPALIRAQLTLDCGLLDDHISWDGLDTMTALDDDGEFRWHSNKRDPKARNQVLVEIRHSVSPP